MFSSGSAKMGFMIAGVLHGLGAPHKYLRRIKCCLASTKRERKCTPASLRFSSFTALRAVLHCHSWQLWVRAELGGQWGPPLSDQSWSVLLVSRFCSFFSSVIYCVFPWKYIFPHLGEMWGNLWFFSSTYAEASTLSTFGVWVMMQKKGYVSIWM